MYAHNNKMCLLSDPYSRVYLWEMGLSVDNRYMGGHNIHQIKTSNQNG